MSLVTALKVSLTFPEKELFHEIGFLLGKEIDTAQLKLFLANEYEYFSLFQLIPKGQSY